MTEAAPQILPQTAGISGHNKGLISPQIAADYQRRAVAARLSSKKAKDFTDSLPPHIAANAPQIIRVQRQLEQVADMIDDATNADELQKLSAAHARLFNTWQVLTATPNPGSRKAGSTRPKPAPAFDPTPATPQPVVSSVSPAPATDLTSPPPVQ
jgi:hypothetical protein